MNQPRDLLVAMDKSGNLIIGEVFITGTQVAHTLLILSPKEVLQIADELLDFIGRICLSQNSCNPKTIKFRRDPAS